MSAGERLYRLLLFLFPAEFRAQFGNELAQWYRDRRRHESAVRVWSEAARDLFRTAPKERVSVVSGDLRYALRGVRRAPAFALAVVGTVALAVTANTSIFSVVNAVLLRPLPFSFPASLVQVAEKNDRLNLPSFGASVLNFDSWRERNRGFTELAGIGFASFSLTGAGEPEQFVGNRISPSLLNVLGVSPVAGRGFTATEEKPGSARVAMIGEGLWSRRFGRDPSLVGRTLTLDGAPAMVVGIAPASLALFSGGEVYVPLTVDPAKENRLNHVIVVVGRLKRDVSLQQAQAEYDTIASGMREVYPEMRDWGIHLLTFRETFVSPQVEVAVLVLFASVVFVLLIGCANIANLLLARGTSREREIAVRTALGASRSRLVHQLMVESVTLSACGGAIGILASIWAVRMINASLPPNLLPVSEVRVDAAVLVFAVLLTIGTGVLFGLAPALHAARKDVNEALKAGGRTGDPGGRRMRSMLAASEIALATVLLIGAGLFLQTFVNLQRAHLGFEPNGLLTFQLAPPVTKYPVNEKAPLLYRALLESLRQVPAVKAAAVSSGIPFGQGNYTTSPVMTTGRSALPPDTPVAIDWRIVSPGYFATMRIPLLRGRDFSDLDGTGAPAVTIVSQATARRFWGDDEPVGRTLKRTADGRSSTVIGVVGDVRSTALNQESPALYYPVASRVWPLMDVVVRSDAPAAALLPIVRQKVRELDPELPVATARTMEEWVSNSAAQPRLSAELVAVFAFMALAIAAVGIYGVMAFFVSQRTRELGIRMALGARPDTLVWVVVKQGMGLALAGLVAGIVGAGLLARAVDSLVYGVAPHDPRTMVLVAALLSAVALLACWVPARRAARLDPLIALRQD